MDAAGSDGLTWLQVAGILLAIAVVVAGAAWFWAHHRRRLEDAGIGRPPAAKPPTPRDPTAP